MVANSIIPEVADRCLNHVEENRIKRTYLQHDYKEEMRDAWKVLGNVLSEILLDTYNRPNISGIGDGVETLNSGL